MLVRFGVENFLSFHDKASLSMVASSERIHPEHIIKAPSASLPRVTRGAVVYGANAAGKSNLVKALRFFRDLVVGGVEPGARIGVERFRLDPEYLTKPSIFTIEIYVEDRLYAYELHVTQEAIIREVLTWIRPTTEEVVYSRTSTTEGAQIEFGPRLRGRTEDDRRFLHFVAKGTRANQPFLSEAVSRNVGSLVPIAEWFRSTLQIVGPDETFFGPLEIQIDEDRSLKEFLTQVVRLADTGISDIETQDVALDAMTSLPEFVRTYAKEHLTDDSVGYTGDEHGRRVAIRRTGDEFIATRITTLHELTCGATGMVSFELDEESDGTRRLFDLIPLLYQGTVKDARKVFVIDEIGRSLHPHLVRLLLTAHLEAEGTTQLIATTHESSLLDLDILRRDEIWFAEKTPDQSTRLYSLADFQPRYDKDVRKDYLAGRYGAVPFLSGSAALTSRSEL